MTTRPAGYTGRAADWRIMHWNRSWSALRSPRFVWQWLRQGRPTSRPVVLPGVVHSTGMPVLSARGERENSRIAIDASTLNLADVTLSFALCEPGVYRADDVIAGLMVRFPILVTLADGSEEIVWAREWQRRA